MRDQYPSWLLTWVPGAPGGGTLLQTLTGSSQTSSPLVHLLQQHHIHRCPERHPCPAPGLGTGGVLRSQLTPRLTLLAPVCPTPVARCTLVPHDWTVCAWPSSVWCLHVLARLCSVPCRSVSKAWRPNCVSLPLTHVWGLTGSSCPGSLLQAMVGAQGSEETSSAPVSILGLSCTHGLSRLNCPGLLLGLDLRGQGTALERSGEGEEEGERSQDPGLAGLGLQREQRGGPHLLPWDGNDQGRAGGRAFLWVLGARLGREELGETRAKLETEWQGQVRAAGARGQRSSCFGDSGESEQKD